MNNEVETKIPMLVGAVSRNGRSNQYLAALIVSIGAFSVGTVLSWTSIAIPYLRKFTQVTSNVTEAGLKDQENPPFPYFSINESEEAWIGAILTIGALISAIPSGLLADHLGRKKTLLALALPLLINWISITYASNAAILLFARLMSGIAVGGFCVVAPIYLSEIADKITRGIFGSFFQLFICCGILFTNITGTFTSWVVLSLILGLVPMIFLVTFYMMPESPLHLLKKNKIFEADVTLRYLRDNNSNDVKEELNSLQKELEEARRGTVSFKSVLRNKCYTRAVLTVVGILVFQQFSGINAIVFYTVPIFEAATSFLPPDVATIIINLVQVLVSYLSTLVIERANRKFYLTISAVGMFLSLFSLGIFFHFKAIDVDPSGVLSVVPVASIVLFMAYFSIGFGPIPWMIIGELPPPEIKGIASGIGVVANWLCAFFVTFCFPLLNFAIGIHNNFYIFAAFMALAVLFVQYVVPETRGLSLIEIQKKLAKF